MVLGCNESGAVITSDIQKTRASGENAAVLETHSSGCVATKGGHHLVGGAILSG